MAAAGFLSAAMIFSIWTSASAALAAEESGERVSSPPKVHGDDQLTFVPAPGPLEPSAAKPVAKAEEAAKEEERKEEEEQEEENEEPWRLIGQLGCSRINVYGWLDMGGTANADNPRSKYNGTLAPNDRDEWQFNQNYLVIERALKTDDCCWDIGGRVDLLYGSDYIYGISTGFETHPDGSQKWDSHFQYGLIMPQAYGEVGYGDVSLKLGRFYTIIGYESLMAPNNFFYSQNYALRYAEPTTHTGGQFTWKLSEELTLYGGGVNGQDRTDGLTDSFAALAGFAYTPKERKYLLNFGIMTGGLEPTLDPTVFAPRTYFSTYYTYNFSEKFQSVSQWDAGWQENFDLADHTADFWSFTQYLFYTINPCWKAGLRYDMFVDDEGTRLGGLRYGGLPGGNPLPLPSGNAGTVQAISLGLNYTPSLNFRLRPEVRWDWFDGEGQPLFDDRTKNGQFTAAMDMILLF
jgi:hypothetical protein